MNLVYSNSRKYNLLYEESIEIYLGAKLSAVFDHVVTSWCFYVRQLESAVDSTSVP